MALFFRPLFFEVEGPCVTALLFFKVCYRTICTLESLIHFRGFVTTLDIKANPVVKPFLWLPLLISPKALTVIDNGQYLKLVNWQKGYQITSFFDNRNFNVGTCK